MLKKHLKHSLLFTLLGIILLTISTTSVVKIIKTNVLESDITQETPTEASPEAAVDQPEPVAAAEPTPEPTSDPQPGIAAETPTESAIQDPANSSTATMQEDINEASSKSESSTSAESDSTAEETDQEESSSESESETESETSTETESETAIDSETTIDSKLADDNKDDNKIESATSSEPQSTDETENNEPSETQENVQNSTPVTSNQGNELIDKLPPPTIEENVPYIIEENLKTETLEYYLSNTATNDLEELNPRVFHVAPKELFVSDVIKYQIPLSETHIYKIVFSKEIDYKEIKREHIYIDDHQAEFMLVNDREILAIFQGIAPKQHSHITITKIQAKNSEEIIQGYVETDRKYLINQLITTPQKSYLAKVDDGLELVERELAFGTLDHLSDNSTIAIKIENAEELGSNCSIYVFAGNKESEESLTIPASNFTLLNNSHKTISLYTLKKIGEEYEEKDFIGKINAKDLELFEEKESILLNLSIKDLTKGSYENQLNFKLLCNTLR